MAFKTCLFQIVCVLLAGIEGQTKLIQLCGGGSVAFVLQFLTFSLVLKYLVPNKLQMLPWERQVETGCAFQWYCDAFRISISRVALKTLDNCKLPVIRGLGSRLDAFPTD